MFAIDERIEGCFWLGISRSQTDLRDKKFYFDNGGWISAKAAGDYPFASTEPNFKNNDEFFTVLKKNMLTGSVYLHDIPADKRNGCKFICETNYYRPN